MESYSIVGKRLPRVDGVVKVTGEAKFMVDVKLPKMLRGKILRSPLPHAKILRIDTTRAERLPGARAVITAKDAPRIRHSWHGGTYLADRFVLADERVRFVGDPVAAVAAIDEDTAEEALELIRVEYEELPAVFDQEAAMEPGAPVVHDHVERNICVHAKIDFGDVEKGFAESDHLFEDRFTTQAQAPCCMEVHGSVAQFDHAGKLTLWTNSQQPYWHRDYIAHALGLSPRHVRVINGVIGGGFGHKGGLGETPICALLAGKTGRPVRIIHTREEEFAVSGAKHPQVIYLKTGVSKDGRIVARQMRSVMNAGAYERGGYISNTSTGYRASQLYAPPNFYYDGYEVYTNTAPGTPLRGFGGPASHFATESQTDLIAEKLGMDPVELRLKNANRAGQVTPGGSIISSCGHSECIQKAAETTGWKEKRGKPGNGGVGIASMIHGGTGARIPPQNVNSAECFIKIDTNGMVDILVGEPDLGQGSSTALSQIAAEELGVRLEDTHLANGDTEAVPLTAEGSWGSRVTFVAGNAVKAGAADVKHQLFEAVAELLEASPDDLEARDRKIYVKGAPDRAVAIGEAVKKAYSKTGRPIAARGYWVDNVSTVLDGKGLGNRSPGYVFAAQVAEVDVDVETGQVSVLNHVAAHDLGFAINPMLAEGQIEGATGMGIGFGLTEEVVFEKGRILNPSFHDYKMPTALDLPAVKPILVEPNEVHGPFGAKGVGEPGLVASAPAMANAIYDAVGVRIKELPITPEKILVALRRRGG